MEKPSLEECLAYQVLCEPEKWLVKPTPKNFNVFLQTALMTVTDENGQTPYWRIFGSLCYLRKNKIWYHRFINMSDRSETPEEKEERERTCFPKFKACLEMDFSKEIDPELLKPLDMSSHLNLYIHYGKSYEDADEQFWQVFASRPSMWLPGFSGCAFQAFLEGFQKGQQWLNVNEHPRVVRMIDVLERESMKRFDDPWEIYRQYDSKLSVLMELCELPPSPFLLNYEMEQETKRNNN